MEALPDESAAAEEEAKTSVWWDMNQCKLPEDGSCDVQSVVESVMSALVEMGYGGPVTVFAYGDGERVTELVQNELFDAGVRFCGVESSGACIKKILEDMLFWALDNPAPANYLLLSGDCDFSYALHRLALKRYNILLAQPEDAPTCLVATAQSVWLWTSILAGEPSLCNGEVFQYSNNVLECSCNRTRNPVSESEQINSSVAFPSESGNDELFCNGSSGDNVSEVSNCSDGKVVIQGQSNGGARQPSASQLFTAPHEFFRSHKSDTSSSSSALSPTRSNPDSPSNGNDWVTVHNVHPSFAPDDIFPQHQYTQNKLPIRSNSAPDSFFRGDFPTHQIFPPSNGPTVTPITDTNIFSTEHPEILFSSSFGHNIYSEGSSNSKYPVHDFSSYGVWGAPGYPEPSEYVQGLIGIVLLALHTLQTEKIIPTEENITDCIRCGDLVHQKTDVRTALKYAIAHEMIVSRSLGALVIYTGAKSGIWNCVNPLGGSQKDYPKAMWSKLYKYLSSSDGQYKMKISASRFEAATYLRRACPKNIALGEVLQVLNMIIEIEKWITVHQSGWQPISIVLGVITTDGDYHRELQSGSSCEGCCILDLKESEPGPCLSLVSSLYVTGSSAATIVVC